MREGLKLTKSGANRMMASLRAALNLAVDNRQVPATAAQEWRGVKPYKGADGRRELYLDLAQRRALLAAATGGVRHLIEAALVTGARPGELVAVPRGAFDATAPLLTRDDGKSWQRAEWTEDVRLAAEAAVVKGVNGNDAKLPVAVCLYSCRHSYITQAIVDGLTTLDVAKLTGTSLAMIDKHYGHLVQTSAERLAEVQMLRIRT